MGAQLAGEVGERGALDERLAAAEGDTVEQGIGENVAEEILRIDRAPSRRVPRFGVLTAGTVMGTALRKNGEAIAVAVDDRVVGDARDAKFHEASTSKRERGK